MLPLERRTNGAIANVGKSFVLKRECYYNCYNYDLERQSAVIKRSETFFREEYLFSYLPRDFS